MTVPSNRGYEVKNILSLSSRDGHGGTEQGISLYYIGRQCKAVSGRTSTGRSRRHPEPGAAAQRSSFVIVQAKRSYCLHMRLAEMSSSMCHVCSCSKSSQAANSYPIIGRVSTDGWIRDASRQAFVRPWPLHGSDW